MSVNLTKYNNCFATLDPAYDVLNKYVNVIQKSQTTYENTKNFVEILKKHEKDFTHFEAIAARISDMNDYFRDCVAVQTNGAVLIDKEITDVKNLAQNGHYLAKNTLQNIVDFIYSLNFAVDELDRDIGNNRHVYLSPEVTDEVDNFLLISSSIDTPLQNQKFGGGKASGGGRGGLHVNRSVTSLLMTEEGMGVSHKIDSSLPQILNGLKRFSQALHDNYGQS